MMRHKAAFVESKPVGIAFAPAMREGLVAHHVCFKYDSTDGPEAHQRNTGLSTEVSRL